MTRLDRRWRQARSLADLGATAADWLEGRVPGEHPNGYDEPDPETTHLVPTLAALNRTGYVTTDSQPGNAARGFDGLWWEQKAWVEGFIADAALLDRLARAASAAGAEALVDSVRPVMVTTRGGEAHTTGGGKPPRSYMRLCWAEVGREAYTALKRAHRLTIVARDFGSSGERLWPALAGAIAEPLTATMPRKD
jgi:hypothetical protein